MNDERQPSDRVFDGLVRRAIVPRGFRPQSDAEIESMLDAIGPGDMSDAKLQRMLGKTHGRIPLSWEKEEPEASSWQPNTAEARELAEMFRARGDELPPELEEKLREMEARAAEFPDEEEDADGG